MILTSPAETSAPPHRGTTAPLIELQDVTIPCRTRCGSRFDGVDLIVRAGETVVMQVDDTLRGLPFFETVLGLRRPLTGSVRAFGTAWHRAREERCARLRSRIGFASARPCLISNLDIDENILLGRLHHSTDAYDIVRADAVAISTALGLGSLSRLRPGEVDHTVLTSASLIRSLLGQPRLILVDRIEEIVDPMLLARYRNLVEERCAQGAGLLWLTGDPQLASYLMMDITRYYRTEGTRLVLDECFECWPDAAAPTLDRDDDAPSKDGARS